MGVAAREVGGAVVDNGKKLMKTIVFISSRIGAEVYIHISLTKTTETTYHSVSITNAEWNGGHAMQNNAIHDFRFLLIP